MAVNYRKYLFESKKKQREWWKIPVKILKYLIYTFVIVVFLWGCGQTIFDSSIATQTASGLGFTAKNGVFFEFAVIFTSQKNHIFHMVNNTIYEYNFEPVRTWGQAFTTTNSPFYGIFIYPIAWITAHLTNAIGGDYRQAGGYAPSKVTGAAPLLGILIVAFVIKLGTISLSWKAQRSSERMTEVQTKQAEIQAKYKNSADPQAKQKQQMELMALYKKNGGNPLKSLGVQFLAFPFWFAMYTTIRTTDILRIAQVGQVDFLTTPWNGMHGGNFYYIIIVLIYFPLQVFVTFAPMLLRKFFSKGSYKPTTAAGKKSERRNYYIYGGLSLVSLVLVLVTPAGSGIYWIMTSAMQGAFVLLFHFYNQWLKKRRKAGIEPVSVVLKGKWTKWKEKHFKQEQI